MKKIFTIHPLSLNIIIGTLFVRMMTFMTFPFLTVYLTTVKGASPTAAGAVIGISALFRLFGGFIGGHLTDRFGRKKVMLSSISIWTFVYIGFALADTIPMFLILNSLSGLCSSFFEPASKAALSDVTKPKNKLLVFNLRYTAINLGAAAGPLIGLQLSTAQSTIGFWFIAIINALYALSLLITFSHYHEDINNESEAKEKVTFVQSLSILKQDTIFLLVLIGSSIGIFGYSHMNSTLPQYFAHAPSIEYGVSLFAILLVTNAITVIVVQFPVTRIGKHFSPLLSVMLGTTMVSVGLMLFGLFSNPVMLFISMIVFTIGEVMMFSMVDVLIDEIAPHDRKGFYFGAMSFMTIGGVLAPVVGGFLMQSLGFHSGKMIFSVLAICSSSGFPILLLASKLLQQKKNQIISANKGA
ncbi:MFS transporter [Bacillus carboniphilus]|uniref:MFS transporter n=1 Tax=Bacillus carboniphilus TaxID=86663 RepID=A0ABY9JSA2_9BACI|nr:MFS transporter [Bacillus carboniphilus]WLR42222.1 MFS transporter [Bacillus carboniphilus]